MPLKKKGIGFSKLPGIVQAGFVILGQELFDSKGQGRFRVAVIAAEVIANPEGTPKKTPRPKRYSAIRGLL